MDIYIWPAGAWVHSFRFSWVAPLPTLRGSTSTGRFLSGPGQARPGSFPSLPSSLFFSPFCPPLFFESCYFLKKKDKIALSLTKLSISRIYWQKKIIISTGWPISMRYGTRYKKKTSRWREVLMQRLELLRLYTMDTSWIWIQHNWNFMYCSSYTLILIVS